LGRGITSANNKLKGLVDLVNTPLLEVAKVRDDLAEGESKLAELEVAQKKLQSL
jgi:hypothetical protein